jgi:murein DD-endopeptidase MepM/ murein hydrolase activator NlpD
VNRVLALVAAVVTLAGPAGAAPAGATGAGTLRFRTAPRLTIEATTQQPKQGAVVALLVRSDRPLAALTLSQGDHPVPLEALEGGTRFRGLVGIDLDVRAGNLPLRFSADEADGRRAPVIYALRVVSSRFHVQRLRVPESYVELPPEILERVKAEQAQVGQVWAAGDPGRRWAGQFRQPVDARPADNFGVRRFFNGQPRAPHTGVDFPAPEGAPVVAPAAARVALAGDLYFSGGTVILDHGGGLFTTYFHLSRIDVAVGDLVEPGQLIAAAGMTGRSTGPHLHWGARLHRARVNPLDLLALPEWPAATALP